MKGLSSTTPPARGLQARAAACTPKKGEGTGRAIERQRCRLKPLRPELRSPVFAGLVADRKSSASKPRRGAVVCHDRTKTGAQARPSQTRTSARRLLALGGIRASCLQIAYKPGIEKGFTTIFIAMNPYLYWCRRDESNTRPSHYE